LENAPGNAAGGAREGILARVRERADALGTRRAVLDVSLTVLPPLGAFLLGTALLVHVALLERVPFLAPATWMKWDGGQYVSIATHGYQLVSCAVTGEYKPTDWCGNCCWLPGYPLLVAAFMRLHAEPVHAALAISATFHFATLLLLWTGFLERKITFANVVVLLYAAFFPSFVFQHAAFPISMCTFFLTLSLFCAAKEKWIASGLAGAVAAFTYSTGATLALVFGLWILIKHWPRSVAELPRLAMRVAASSGLTVVGFGLVLVAHQILVGAWNAFFKIHAHYGHGIHNPVVTLMNQLNIAADKQILTGAEVLLFVPVVVGMVWATEMHRGWTERLDSLLVVYLLIFWIFPLVIGGEVTNRAEAPLLPCAFLTRRWSKTAQLTVLVFTVLMDYELASMFYRGRLI
jgi:hypothetical protein